VKKPSYKNSRYCLNKLFKIFFIFFLQGAPGAYIIHITHFSNKTRNPYLDDLEI